MSTTKTAALILAAGKGTRMRSELPKVLHPVGGVPMVAHTVHLALQRKCNPVVVVLGAEGRRVQEVLRARFPQAPLVFATQVEQLGTGHAALCGLEAIPDFRGQVLILYGDVPLLSGATVQRLQKAAVKGRSAILTAHILEPNGYGRVVRNGKGVAKVVEDADCTAEERAIREVNVGVYVVDAGLLGKTLRGLGRGNRQGEYYLTDIVAAGPTQAVVTADLQEIQGVNTRQQLALAEAHYQERRVRELIEQGVIVRAPQHLFIEGDVVVERDVVLGMGVQLFGRTHIKRGARIDGPTVIKDSIVEAGAVVHSFCHLEDANVGREASVGPFARLRPEADLGPETKVGNFVEIKKSRLHKGAKASHLAYLGDAEVGPDANIGAGTITCNYDGAGKHVTRIGKGVFVGSNSTLVAPLTVHPGAYIAAGSTITRDIPKDALAFGRARQEARPGYAKRLRQRLAEAKRALRERAKR